MTADPRQEWTDDERDEHEKRAAIKEYMGHMPRNRAEDQARQLVEAKREKRDEDTDTRTATLEAQAQEVAADRRLRAHAGA